MQTKMNQNSIRRVGVFVFSIVGCVVLILAWLEFNGELFVDSRFKDNRIIGKAASEIIQMDGLPAVDSRSQGHPPDGSDNFKLIYFSGFQNILIRFEHGRAVEVSHSTK
jgi:hypothetical protein